MAKERRVSTHYSKPPTVKTVYDKAVKCKCGSGDYCHRHRAYGSVVTTTAHDRPVLHLMLADTFGSGRRKMHVSSYE
jgi:hypothetical protein